jgi:hypothetical protein
MSISLTQSGTSPRVDFDQPTLLLVEGRDDQYLAKKMLEILNVSSVQIHGMNGNRTNWPASLKLIAKERDLHGVIHSVGLVRDADNDVVSAFQSCSDALRSAGFPVPTSAGQVVTGDRVRSGIYLMPSCWDTGDLETLLVQAVSPPERVTMARSYIDEISRHDMPSPPDNKKGKAVIRAVFAGSPRVPSSVPVALDQGVFDLRHQCLQHYADFLRDLACGNDCGD